MTFACHQGGGERIIDFSEKRNVHNGASENAVATAINELLGLCVGAEDSTKFFAEVANFGNTSAKGCGRYIRM